MNKYGAVLDDFGLEAMLNQFMEQFIAPISKGCMIDCFVVVKFQHILPILILCSSMLIFSFLS